jgi:putative transposase
MRKEEFTVGSFVHIYNRGSRKQAIVRDDKDRKHFLEMLYYFNDTFAYANPFRGLRKLNKNNTSFARPAIWPIRDPLVKILAFALLDNHFHLFVKEIKERGASTFMQKLGTGMTMYFNNKYQEVGGLFQGSYKAKHVDKEAYLKYLSVYIQVKNIFELYPGGLQKALRDFDDAYEWAVGYPYCSLADYTGKKSSQIVDKDILGDLFPDAKRYKEFARQCISTENLEEKLESVIF